LERDPEILSLFEDSPIKEKALEVTF
ncbi:MAG: hypothetical protein ThorAB25_29230, partial [Candidatus Thorarchaeota archaeon AB_25]